MSWIALIIISFICFTTKALLARIWSQTSQNQQDRKTKHWPRKIFTGLLATLGAILLV